ncbi:type 1 glutamine amidotransferase [Archaeoglobales archaeon]|nr:MAG: type 1 glutamine amidotransferase [Archaeoglobales archaeon]
MKVIAIKNAKGEPLEFIEEILSEKDTDYEYVEIYETNEINKTGTHYVVLGGPMGVYETDKYPFLEEEMKFIRECFKQAKPILGICLGAQLIAGAFGERVYPFKREIGWYEIKKSQDDQFNRNLPREMSVFQWHGDTFDLPRQAELLFEGDVVKNQGFRIGRMVGLQFHLEVRRDTVEKWLKTEKNLSEDEKKRIVVQTENYIDELHKNCRIMVENFLNL